MLIVKDKPRTITNNAKNSFWLLSNKLKKLKSGDTSVFRDLDINPKDVEQAMEKWLWRYRDGGQFAKAKWKVLVYFQVIFF